MEMGTPKLPLHNQYSIYTVKKTPPTGINTDKCDSTILSQLLFQTEYSSSSKAILYF